MSCDATLSVDVAVYGPLKSRWGKILKQYKMETCCGGRQNRALNLELIRLARDRCVILFCLPSHSTHTLQLLDVGVYGPLKSQWGKILKEYKMETCRDGRQNRAPRSLKKSYGRNLLRLKTLRQAFVKLDYVPSQQKISLNPALHPYHTPYHHTSPRHLKKGDKDAWVDTDAHLILVQVKCCEIALNFFEDIKGREV